MNNPITLNDLVAELQKLVDEGHGDKTVSVEEYQLQAGRPHVTETDIELHGKS